MWCGDVVALNSPGEYEQGNAETDSAPDHTNLLENGRLDPADFVFSFWSKAALIHY
jgi:hypothetical protein